MKMKFHPVKRHRTKPTWDAAKRIIEDYMAGWRAGYTRGVESVRNSIPYRETTDHEREHIELLLMVEDERYDRDIVPEWTLS